MKFLLKLLLVFFLLNNCSFNKNSKILIENDDLMLMTFDEFQIFMDDYVKKSKYPEINK